MYTPNMYIYVYIYIERERERERGTLDGNPGISDDQETLLLLIFDIHIGKGKH